MKQTLFFLVGCLLFSPGVSANYEQELQSQIEEFKKKYPQPRHEAFRDAGILVRKADDAGLYELAAEILRTQLFANLETYVKTEINEINRLYETSAFEASRRLQDLIRYEKYYQPSDEFMRTASAQAILTEIVQQRKNALLSFERGCPDFAVLEALTALRTSGGFVTQSPAEYQSLRDLNHEIGCCLGWKSEIRLKRKQPFKTDYDAGEIAEEGKLRLESSRTDLQQARWAGEYLYKFKGRDGEGLGVSQAVLIYHRGSDQASLAITPSRLTSTGRMNFPHAVSGESRTLEVEGNPINSSLSFYPFLVPVTGCRDVALPEDDEYEI